ncbi:MAG: ATP synthase F1 subunit gamma [Candidatus Aminicenantes bacterium]|nr:MAG: ATP synthase F1 subunit gamma [Candidatus Aminicenantes bacterium]
MPALIDLRRRIKSVKNTQQITQAMKTVSTAKFKKAQREVLQARPYWKTFPDFLRDAVSLSVRVPHPLLEKRAEEKALLVIITSDKGLCGAFNSNLLAAAQEFYEEKSKVCELKLILFGKKAHQQFNRSPYKVERTYTDQIQKLLEEDLNDLSRFLMQQYIFCRTDAIYVLSNEFKSILAPRIVLLKLLPIEIAHDREDQKNDEMPVTAGPLPDWEPGASPILHTLLPKYVEMQFVHFFAESIAAEHAARMMAMDNATKNAEDLIDDLTLVLNKIRQASITKELLEIMTAVEALAKK